MKSLLLIGALFFASQSQAARMKTYSCADGDTFLSLRTAMGESTLRAGICEFTTCDDRNLVGQKNPIDSEGNRKTYDIIGQPNVSFVVSFDANADVVSVEKTQGRVTVQNFTNCSAD